MDGCRVTPVGKMMIVMQTAFLLQKYYLQVKI